MLAPLAQNFKGLPTIWAQRASALLGEVYLAASQTDKAEAAFADFQKLYPDAGSSVDVGLAELARVWLETRFAGGRHIVRINKIMALERGGFSN